MGTLSFPGLATAQVEAVMGSLTIGQSVFPSGGSEVPPPRSTASFGQSQSSFMSRSRRQEVTTSSAVIDIGISIVGVNFNGSVSLTFADSQVDINDLHIVDEGGFCSETNKISAFSNSGTLEIVNPYSNMRLRISGGKSIPEAVAPVINDDGTSVTSNPDGSTTEVDAEGNSTTTSVQGNETIVQEVLSDGTTIETVKQSNGSSATSTVLADGTSIEATQASNGNKTSFTVLPDGSTIDATEANNGNQTSFTTLADGTTIDVELSSNGNTNSVTVSPEGNVDTKSTKSNGSVSNSTVNVDGSSYTFDQRTNGKVFITTVDVDGTEVYEEYIPWKSFYTKTTTPPGTSERITPNPYAA